MQEWNRQEALRRKHCKVCNTDWHDTLQAGVCPSRLETPLQNVTAFQGGGDVLSNFYLCKVHVYGRDFASSEHAYQHMKALYNSRSDIALQILYLETARDVKILSKQIRTDDRWQKVKVKMLAEIAAAKAACVPEYRSALLNSREIIAEAVADDTFWSCGLSKTEVMWSPVDKWPGQNVMGQIAMDLRKTLRDGGHHQEVCRQRLLLCRCPPSSPGVSWLYSYITLLS